MASNTNSPKKVKGSNEPDKKLSVQSDAADVDWMIMTDISTRIGGSSQIKPKSNPVSLSPQKSINQSTEDDREDLEWLQSLDLNEPIKRSPAPTNTAAESNNNNVEDIDWLIMTNLQTKIDDSDIKAKVDPSYKDISQSKTTFQSFEQEASTIDIGLDDALELDGLGFLEGSDFFDLDSLGFDTSESLNIDELQNKIDNTEGKIQGLAEMLDDEDDSSFDFSNDGNDQDWDSISGILEGDTNDSFSDQPSFDIVNEANDSLISDELSKSTYQEDLLINNLELSIIKTDEIVSNFQDFEFSNELENAVKNEFQSESQNNLGISQDISFDEEANNLEESNNAHEFKAAQPLASSHLSMAEDEIWSSKSSSLKPEITDEIVDDAFTSDWGRTAEGAIAIDDDDAVWDSTPIINTELVSSTSIENAFGSFDDWESLPEVEQESDEININANDSNLNWDVEPNDRSITGIEDWSARLESEIDNGNEAIAWDEELVKTEDYLKVSDEAPEVFDNEVVDFVEDNLVENKPLEESIDDNFDFRNDFDDKDWAIANDTNDLESMLDENFDLASFDENSFPEISLPDPSIDIIPTMLTPIRVAPVSYSEDAFTSDFAPTPPINYADNSTPLEDALANDLRNQSDKVDLHEESLVVNKSDHDFLDDFELDNFELNPLDAIADRKFDSGFISPPTITGLTPSAPKPPSFPPVTKQEPTSPSLNNPPPPPFLPPLPPKRNPTKVSPPKAPTLPIANTGSQSQLKMGIRNDDDDFEQFHDQLDQHENRNSIHPIGEEWSELLDSDTVLSSGRSSTGSSYSEPSITKPPSAGLTAGRTSQGRDNRNSSGIPKRKETGLPNFNDLGLEVHDDNADWSGLLDSSDLSDNITTISPQSTQLPFRIRTNQTNTSRPELTSTSETREIPRDRRQPMANLGDTNQSRMGITPDQVDFNRFTEDNDDTYDEHMKSVELSSTAPSKPKITMPSVSLESLWQDYLKIPAIGLGVIGGAFLLYSLLNRPVFDLGLRWGLFKDARGKDYTNADFKGANLDNVDFSDAILTGAKMQDASLVGANFQKANLDGVNFTNANLSRARLIQASVVWAEFNKAQMNLVDLEGADLTLSNFVNAKMDGTNLLRSKIGAQGTNKATKFSPAMLLAWQIVNEPREGRNLARQDLSGLNLSFTSLKRANLSNTKLNYTDLTGTDLRGSNLTGSQINGANWSGAKLNGINLTGATFDKNKLPKTDEETICPNGKKGPCSF